MKKVVVASKRITREFLENPHQDVGFHTKAYHSNCIDFAKNSTIIDYDNGYSKIIFEKGSIDRTKNHTQR